MADEEKNEQTEQEEQAEEKDPKAEAEEKAPEAEAPAEEEAPSEDTPDEGEEAPEEESPVEEEAPAEEAPDEAEEAAAEGEEAPSAEAPAEEEGDWKARRRLERSRRSGAAGPQRSPEDRAAERTQRRSLAARRRSSYRKKRRGKTGPGEGTPPAERRSAGRKVRQGRVVSDKPDKTITVQIEVVRRHTHYEKIIRHSNTLHAHDERNEANQGDLVRVVETRPLSRTKRWRLVEILEKAK